MESDLSRREFLERTALAAGLAGSAALPASAILAEAGAGALVRQPAALAAQHPDRPLRHPDDGEPVVRPLLRVAAPGGRQAAAELPERARPAGADAPFLDARHRRHPVQGLRPPRPGPRLGVRAALSCNGGFLAPGSGNDEFALTYFNQGDLGFIHEAARNYTSYDRYFCSILASTWPNRFYKWSAQSGGLKSNTLAPGGNNWETIFDRAISKGLTARYYASDLPFAALFGGARGRLDQPDLALLRGLLPRHAAEHRDRGPALPRRRRRRRAVGRRAPARRRAPRPGVHVRRGARVHRDQGLQARRAVRDLRRVGRLLRPRAPAARAGRPRQHRSQRGLRADGLPRPGGRGLAVRPPRQEALALGARRQRLGPQPRSTSTTASTATSRSSSSSRTGSGSATSTRA